MATCTATIRSISNPDLAEVNVRSGPGTTYDVAFRAPAGTSELPVLQVHPDENGINYQGKVYQWFQLDFGDGRSGWVRDDLVQIIGDCSAMGYGVIWVNAFAFPLVRTEPIPVPEPVKATEAPALPKKPKTDPKPAAQPVSVTTEDVTEDSDTGAEVDTETPQPKAKPAAHAPDNDSEERIRKAAFNITAAWEGAGYGAYQNYDTGIISYGRFQFTLAAGSLINIINQFVARSTSATAAELSSYRDRINARDESLRSDDHLRRLLVQAADEPVMQELQDQTATSGFWQPVHALSINPRGVTLPLVRALMFDMAINHGLYNRRINEAEDALGVPYKSRVIENGVSEEDFALAMAKARQDFMYRFADKHGFPGLKVRGDFWVELVQAGDWYLQGDDNGMVNVNGQPVPVRNP